MNNKYEEAFERVLQDHYHGICGNRTVDDHDEDIETIREALSETEEDRAKRLHPPVFIRPDGCMCFAQEGAPECHIEYLEGEYEGKIVIDGDKFNEIYSLAQEYRERRTDIHNKRKGS